MAGLARHLSRRGRTLNLDLRGHGASGRPSSYGAAGFVSDVKAVAKAGRLPSAVLVGHSMGGRVALAVAEAMPSLVAGLILLDVAVDEDPAYVRTRRGQLDEPDWRRSLERRIAGLWPLPASRSARRVKALMLGTPHDTAVASLEAADEIDCVRALGRLDKPALYVGASTPREGMATLKAIRPDLAYAQVVGSGHFVQHDASRQVTAIIGRFCELHWPLAPTGRTRT